MKKYYANGAVVMIRKKESLVRRVLFTCALTAALLPVFAAKLVSASELLVLLVTQ